MCDKSVINIEQINMNDENNVSDCEDIIDHYIGCDEPTDIIKQYKILTQQEVIAMMNKAIIDVTDVIKLDDNAVRVLLNKYNWDKQKLYDDYYDERNVEKFSKLNIDKQTNRRYKTETYCLICYSEVLSTHMSSLLCEHKFCIECVRQYVTTKINESIADGIVCPLFDECGCYVDDQLIDLVITLPLTLKYRKLILNSFVCNNKYLRWCAYPDCSYVIKVNRIQFQPITCKCGYRFCFQCSEIWHEPTRCDLMKMWRTKCSEGESMSDSATSKWLLSNAKDCPKCKSQIEKNGGCNHMTCSYCNHEFCWLCLMNWRSHESRSCNQYEQKLHNDRQSAKVLLERFNHYWTRFKNHEKSMNAEKIMWKEFCTQSDQLTIKGVTGEHIKSILRDMELLCNCRQTLMFSYPFAFYVKENNQTKIFETNQSDLELNAEKLSRHLEAIHKDSMKQQCIADKIMALKSTIMSESIYCDRRRQVLVDHVNEGYDNRFWNFITDQ